MNRVKAKLITIAGGIFVIASIILLICNLIGKIDISSLIVALFFVFGIILIALSLAYYTEK